MTLRNVRIIFAKEMVDTLRDRRTLVAMIVIPILLFPLLTLGIWGLVGKQVMDTASEVSDVALLGLAPDSGLVSYIQQGDQKVRVVEVADPKAALQQEKIQAVLEVTPGFEEAVDAERPTRATILYDKSILRSITAGEKLYALLEQRRQEVLQTRLDRRGLSPEFVTPFQIEKESVASREKMGGFLLGSILPYMVIVLALTGAMYPAIDLTAGEKERGTLETLLVSPALRIEMVLGKFLTVMTASVTTSLLAVLSLLCTFKVATSLFESAVRQVMEAFEIQSSIMIIGIREAALLLMLLLPLACVFSAGLLAISILAKSYKEAQSYISPIMFLVILPGMVSFMPGFEMNTAFSLIPVANVSLLFKEILMGKVDVLYITLTFLSTVCYAALTLAIAASMFGREGVLFRE